MMNPEGLLEILKSRRSVRKFLPDPVPEHDIEKIITAASWAPSGTNHQNWHFTVVRSPEIKNSMVAAVKEQVIEYSKNITLVQAQQGFLNYTNYFSFFNTAPVVITVIKKPYDSVTQKLMRRYGLSDAFMSTTDVQGPAAAIQNLVLMAHALGYGTCWMTGPLIAKEKLEKILSIQEPDSLLALIPIGRPAHSPAAPRRKEVKGIVNYL